MRVSFISEGAGTADFGGRCAVAAGVALSIEAALAAEQDAPPTFEVKN